MGIEINFMVTIITIYLLWLTNKGNRKNEVIRIKINIMVTIIMYIYIFIFAYKFI